MKGKERDVPQVLKWTMIPKPLAIPARLHFMILERSKRCVMKLKLPYAYKHQDITLSNPRLQQIYSQIAIIPSQCTS
jgi:hypothetical protein